MIVITTPTGQVGSQLVGRLLDGKDPLRVIARDPSRLDAGVRERIEVVRAPTTIRRCLTRRCPGPRRCSGSCPQLAGTERRGVLPRFREGGRRSDPPPRRPPRRRGLKRRARLAEAGRSSVGRVRMDAELERSGAAYRALSMPFYMENLDRNLDAIREQGVLSLPYARRPAARHDRHPRHSPDRSRAADRPLMDRTRESSRLRTRPADPEPDRRGDVRRARPASHLPADQPRGPRLQDGRARRKRADDHET